MDYIVFQKKNQESVLIAVVCVMIPVMFAMILAFLNADTFGFTAILALSSAGTIVFTT